MSAANNNDEFDVLTFFIIVMVVLTLIVGVFAYVLFGNVDKESRRIKTELRNLTRMQEMATDKKLRNWIAQEREGGGQQGDTTEFAARLVTSSNAYNVKITRRNAKMPIVSGGIEELPVDVTIASVDLEPLTKFLFEVEEKWLGAKVKTLRLTWLKKTEVWKAEVVFSIFRPAEPKS